MRRTAATLEMFQYLARHTRRLRLVIVGTYRPEEVQAGRPLDRLFSAARRDGSAQVILLPQLNRDETQALMADRLTGQRQRGAHGCPLHGHRGEPAVHRATGAGVA